MKTLMVLCFVLGFLPGCKEEVTAVYTTKIISTKCFNGSVYDVYDHDSGAFLHFNPDGTIKIKDSNGAIRDIWTLNPKTRV